jgi:hypothetical protein
VTTSLGALLAGPGHGHREEHPEAPRHHGDRQRGGQRDSGEREHACNDRDEYEMSCEMPAH